MGIMSVSHVSSNIYELSAATLLQNTPISWTMITTSGGVPAISKSINTSSIADRGTGQLTINFAADSLDSDYTLTGGGRGTDNATPCFIGQQSTSLKSASSFDYTTISDDNVFTDFPRHSVECHGDFA